MPVWRLAIGRHREIDGEGARLYGGRWNSPGVPMVYAATHLSLALLEQLVHLDPARLPGGLRAFAIELPEDAPVEAADPAVDAADRRPHAGRRCLGGEGAYRPHWWCPRTVPARLDPGGIATAERNVLLNPRHASVAAWRVRETAFRVDPRLKRAARHSAPACRPPAPSLRCRRRVRKGKRQCSPSAGTTRLPSRHVTVGPDRAPHRSYYYAMGLTEEEIDQPFVGVATCWNEAAPCNIALSRQAQSVKKGVSEAGGTPREFTTITVTDGIAMGHQGMKSSLVSRE